ncbi:hypothetical protein EDB80DRAFT_688169 [Ilyonectria destructans]|nr:hypothetical protein EDB80DRAFT_688169 [Ilyonectria destructans]
MKVSGSYAAITALAATANARHLLVRSEPTVAVSLADNGVSPRPTEAPEYDLLRRADQGTLLYAPDNTCGFISGLEGAGYTCFGTYTCAFSISKDEGHVACCADSVCNMRFACIDYAGYFSSSQCTGGCDVDALTLKCTETSAPYCNTISFSSGGVSDYWCNSQNISTARMATTTFSGGDARVYTTQDDTSSSASVITSGSADLPTVTVSSKPSSTSGSASETTSSGSSSGGSSTPVGPIVGGVVGGVGALAIAGAAIWFCLRNKKKKEAAAATTAPPTYQSPNMQQPGVGPNGYNPVPQGQAGYYDPKNAYSTPTQQYNQTAVPGFYPQNQPGSPDYSQTNPSSPGTYDPRMAHSTTSPSPSYNQQMQGQPGFQPQQAVIHEAPANAVGSNGRGDTHELA